MTGYRSETDSFGPIDVANDHYWAAQTQRSLQNFKIGGPAERMRKNLDEYVAVLHEVAAIAFGQRVRH